MFPISKMKREKKLSEYRERAQRKRKKNEKALSLKQNFVDFPYAPSEYETSDSDCELTPSTYLHDKMGVFMQDENFQDKAQEFSDIHSSVSSKDLKFKREFEVVKHEPEENETSDSDCGLASSSYLHEKIGIYVQDDSGNPQDKTQLVKLLPVDFGVVIVSYIADESLDNRPCFSCSLRLNITDKETILRWLKLFEQKTYTVYRVDSTFKCEKSKKLVFKKNFRCQNKQYVHQNRKKENTRKKRIEHTGCPAKVSLTIKQQEMHRTTDPYLKHYPAVINLRFNHNHDFRTERDIHKIYKKPKKRSFEETKHISEYKIIESKNVISEIKEIVENKRKEDVVMEHNLDDKKTSLLNNDWSEVLCNDVFLERSNNSICLQKEGEISPYEDTFMEIDRCCAILKQKTLEKPELFHLPLMNFLEVFNSLKSDNDMASALTWFGRYNGSVISYKKEDADIHGPSLGVAAPELRHKQHPSYFRLT